MKKILPADGRSGINLLLTDDSETIINRLQTILSAVENIASIDTAGTISRAKEIITEKKIDVVVLDIQLPDGDGIELLKWIKEKHPSIIVIMFSTFSETFFRSLSKRLGADYFLDKSDEFEQVPEILSKIKPANKDE